MNAYGNDSKTRVVFLDNLRYLFILCVVAQHSANAYYGHLRLVEWWPVIDGSASTALGVLQVTLNGFTMPLLFFLAGYFALPTIRKHGIPAFIRGKLRRLGIPWVVCILTICPLWPLVYHYTRNDLTLTGNYFDLWCAIFKSFLRFDVGVIPSMDALMMHNGFYQRYMWFISLLLLFFMIFASVYGSRKKWFEANCPATEETPTVWKSIKMLCTVGSLCFAGSMFAGGMVILSGHRDPASWFTVANLFQFQMASLPSFMLYFGIGVIANRNKWIARGRFPGHLNTWLVSTCVLLIVYIPTLHAMLTATADSTSMKLYGVFFVLTGSFLTFSLLAVFSSLAIRYGNRPTRMNRNLAANSYNMYLSHYLFVLVFQLLLFTIPGIPAWMKFSLVCIASMACAYLVSNYLIRPYPKITAGLLFVMLGVMFRVVRV